MNFEPRPAMPAIKCCSDKLNFWLHWVLILVLARSNLTVKVYVHGSLKMAQRNPGKRKLIYLI